MKLARNKTYIATAIYDYIMAFYGPPGVGKTTFVDGLSDRTFFISTDRGTRFRKMLREEVNNEKELVEVIRELERGQAKYYRYKLIALDHIDDICSMVEESTCKRLGIDDLGDLEWSKGYKQFKKRLWSIMQRLLKLDAGLAFIAHENIRSVKKTKNNSIDKIMPDMGRSAWKILMPKCDLVGYCGYGKDNQRVLRTDGTFHIYAKDRTRRVKPKSGCQFMDNKKFVSTFRKV